ncbi:hypothetical protein NCAST_34_03840 [Nocardia asteroides NBRC 15531]|uniref:Uncharacterized protein n=1 Tax=Nocardia asteroides NBRC 15531 TaxID=1110697 RepID=U5EQA2_NOCAS|nr:hypothetical protein NCAST_34_03840 [Nocardia asteroides NBRC 15531]
MNVDGTGVDPGVDAAALPVETGPTTGAADTLEVDVAPGHESYSSCVHGPIVPCQPGRSDRKEIFPALLGEIPWTVVPFCDGGHSSPRGSDW